jgi:hypothetical protein
VCPDRGSSICPAAATDPTPAGEVSEARKALAATAKVMVRETVRSKRERLMMSSGTGHMIEVSACEHP